MCVKPEICSFTFRHIIWHETAPRDTWPKHMRRTIPNSYYVMDATQVAVVASDAACSAGAPRLASAAIFAAQLPFANPAVCAE